MSVVRASTERGGYRRGDLHSLFIVNAADVNQIRATLAPLLSQHSTLTCRAIESAKEEPSLSQQGLIEIKDIRLGRFFSKRTKKPNERWNVKYLLDLTPLPYFRPHFRISSLPSATRFQTEVIAILDPRMAQE